jgi:hypothetical protein
MPRRHAEVHGHSRSDQQATATKRAPVTPALWLCALYIGLPLVDAYIVFLRRDVAVE